MRAKITKRKVDEIRAGDRQVRLYDTELRGFGLLVQTSGHKSFFVEYGPTSKRRRMKIGVYGPMTVDEARGIASNTLGLAHKGSDPLEAKSAEAEILTFAQWVEKYLKRVATTKKAPRFDVTYLGVATDSFGTKKITEVTATDIAQIFETFAADGKRVSGNRWLASVRSCLQAAWREQLIEVNPAMRIKPKRDSEPRERVLTDAEFVRLLDEIDKLEDPHVQIAFKLLVETGARVSEVLQAKWEDMDLEDDLWRLPKTKSARVQYLPLTPALAESLGELSKIGPYVVPGRREGKPRADLKGPWNAIREASDLLDVHLHDLRRTFGLQITKQAGLHVASKLLRHSDPRVTFRHYAPAVSDDLRQAMVERESNVIPLRRKKVSKAQTAKPKTGK